MAQKRENIHAQCAAHSVEKVRELVESDYFNNPQEAGWAREWIEIKEREAESFEIAKRSERMSWIATVVSIVGAFIALIALLNGSS